MPSPWTEVEPTAWRKRFAAASRLLQNNHSERLRDARRGEQGMPPGRTWLELLRFTPSKGYSGVVIRAQVIPRLQELSQDQWGLVTRRQMAARGIGKTSIELHSGPGGVFERVATGIYRLAAAPVPDDLELRAAWLQLEPEIAAWDRTPAQGAVSHRSAASLYGLGHLPADVHEFTVPRRKGSRRPDVRIHVRELSETELAEVGGLPVTTPSRIVSDLLWEHEDPEAVAFVAADALRLGYERPARFAEQLAAHAHRFGLRKGDGQGLLGVLLDLAGYPHVDAV